MVPKTPTLVAAPGPDVTPCRDRGSVIVGAVYAADFLHAKRIGLCNHFKTRAPDAVAVPELPIRIVAGRPDLAM